MTAIASNIKNRPFLTAQVASLVETCESILVTRFKSIGDVLLTLPAVNALRDNFPNAKIIFLTSKEYGPLVEGFPEVGEVITVDRSLYRQRNVISITRETFGLLRRLRRKKFSLAVDFQGYGETALLCWLTRAPKRWGSVYRATRRWAYTRGITRNLSIHPAEWYLSLLRQCGLSANSVRNEFVVPANALAEARELFARWHLDTSRPVLFIQPFTSKARKNWPLENYLAVAAHWRARGVQVLFGGGPSERAMLEPVSQAGFVVSAGASLLVSAGLMKLSTVIIGGDTGLSHLAVAMDRRVVFLTEPSSTLYPFRHPDWRISPPDGLGISGITTSTVTDACARAFAERCDADFNCRSELAAAL